jgi:hypothetical protein
MENENGDTSRRAGVAQLVERVLAKHKVDGSKPFTRSNLATRSEFFAVGELRSPF